MDARYTKRARHPRGITLTRVGIEPPSRQERQGLNERMGKNLLTMCRNNRDLPLTGGITPILLIILVATMVLVACGNGSISRQQAIDASSADNADSADDDATATAQSRDQVIVQLKWVRQAQFAGYYAALHQGFYADEGLEVMVRPATTEIVSEQMVANGQADFGIDWLGSLLAVRDQGVPLVNIAQIFQYSGMREISWKENNITHPEDLRGKRVGVWFSGNEYNLLATLSKYDIDPHDDLTLVPQSFDVDMFLNHDIDTAAAMTYNELYQVLSAGHSIDELNVIDFNKEGTAMLEDGIFVRADWLEEPANRDSAARFLRATFEGWRYCRDAPDACVDIILEGKTGGVMTKEAQQWQMDEVNKLIWGETLDSDIPIGYMDPQKFQQTADIALQFDVIEEPATSDAYTHDIWEMAMQDR